MTGYSHFLVYDFEVILVSPNEHPKDDLTYSSRHTPVSVAIHDRLGREPVCLVDENPERLIQRFIELLTGKKEAIF